MTWDRSLISINKYTCTKGNPKPRFFKTFPLKKKKKMYLKSQPIFFFLEAFMSFFTKIMQTNLYKIKIERYWRTEMEGAVRGRERQTARNKEGHVAQTECCLFSHCFCAQSWIFCQFRMDWSKIEYVTVGWAGSSSPSLTNSQPDLLFSKGLSCS